MKNISLKIFGLILSLGALPLVCGITGCAGNRQHQSTGEYIDDKADSSRVRKALNADTQYKYDGVNVETFKGVVQLSGFVNSKDEKKQAGEVAKTVEGITEVKNNLIVKAN
jgi:hyperosmotically inducible periplasmic protein